MKLTSFTGPITILNNFCTFSHNFHDFVQFVGFGQANQQGLNIGVEDSHHDHQVVTKFARHFLRDALTGV